MDAYEFFLDRQIPFLGRSRIRITQPETDCSQKMNRRWNVHKSVQAHLSPKWQYVYCSVEIYCACELNFKLCADLSVAEQRWSIEEKKINLHYVFKFFDTNSGVLVTTIHKYLRHQKHAEPWTIHNPLTQNNWPVVDSSAIQMASTNTSSDQKTNKIKFIE